MAASSAGSERAGSVAFARRRPRRPFRPMLLAWLLASFFPAVGGGCTSAPRPSNARDWSPDQAVLATADFKRDRVEVRNIRNCTYLTADDYVVDHYDKTFDLDDLETVDFVMVPFKGAPALAHTLLSFGFAGGDYLAVSVEVRKERGETYSVVGGLLQQFEIMYVVADERDAVRLRTDYRHDDVYVYRARATPKQVRALFVDVMKRVNELAKKPEFYDTLTNNCTTNIARHINSLAPDRVPTDPRILLPGYSDRLAYDLGLLETDLPFAQAKKQARVASADSRAAAGDFSQAIRR